MLSCVQRQTVVPSAGTNSLLAGDQFQFIDGDCLVDFGFVAEAAGLLVDVFFTERNIARQLRPTIKAAGTMPVKPDDYPIWKTDAYAGENVIIAVANSSGGNVNLNWVFCCHPAGA